MKSSVATCRARSLWRERCLAELSPRAPCARSSSWRPDGRCNRRAIGRLRVLPRLLGLLASCLALLLSPAAASADRGCCRGGGSHHAHRSSHGPSSHSPSHRAPSHRGPSHHAPTHRSYGSAGRPHTSARPHRSHAHGHAPHAAAKRPRILRPRSDRVSSGKHTHRSVAAKDRFMRSTGHPHGWAGHVVDHVVPLACGGADAPSNMQWQTTADARTKDRTERRGCRR